MEKRKILIAGRVNHDNYGDTLMVAIVAEYCAEAGYDVFVVGSGDFLVRQLKEIGIDIKNIDRESIYKYDFDKCIFTGGGYLAHNFFNGKSWCRKWLNDGYFTDIYDYLKSKNIPYCVLSVEVGPIKSPLMRAAVRSVFNDAKFVYVRNQQSLLFTKRNITNSAHINYSDDMVLTELDYLVSSMQKKNLLSCSIEEADSPIIGIHVTDKFDGSNFLKKEFVKQLVAAINENSNLKRIYLFSDNEETTNLDDAFKYLVENLSKKKNISIHRFHSLREVIEIINQCSHVFTTKLHVGVSSISLGKHVLCLSDTPKSKRFYNSLSLSDSHKYFYLRNPFLTKKYIVDFISESKIADLSKINKCFYKSLIEKFL